jgi:putative toxin-antitoxin system antitoxin component (TIGR02293 family)
MSKSRPRPSSGELSKSRPRPPSEELLRDALDSSGRYNVDALAKCLDWTKAEIAKFLETGPSTLSREAAPQKHQDNLARLAAVMKHLLDHTGNDVGQARAWLRTPLLVLDHKSPKDVILSGNLDIVTALLDEIESGFAA